LSGRNTYQHSSATLVVEWFDTGVLVGLHVRPAIFGHIYVGILLVGNRVLR
jgi:hypothetical protein